jgi:hypothetical protein
MKSRYDRRIKVFALCVCVNSASGMTCALVDIPNWFKAVAVGLNLLAIVYNSAGLALMMEHKWGIVDGKALGGNREG